MTFSGDHIAGDITDVTQIGQVIAEYGVQDVWLHFILPASDFSYLVAEVPAKQVRYIHQTLPFIIEESLAEDIEEMHLVVGERLSPQNFPVFVARKQVMSDWYESAGNIQIPLYGLYLDATLVQSDSHDIAVLFDGDDVLVYGHGITCVRTLVPNLVTHLELLSSNRSDSMSLLVFINDDVREDHSVVLAQLEHLDNISCEVETFSASPFELLSSSFMAGQDSVNLCSKEFPGSQQSKATGISKWLPLAAVVLLGFLIQIGFDLAEAHLHQRQAEQYRQQSAAIYKNLFPNERIVASPRRQLEGKLRNAGNSSLDGSFLAMLGEAGYQLSRHPQKSRMTLNNMQYSEQRRQLAMEVSAPSLEDLDTFKQSISQSGYQVSIGSAIREENAVRGKLTVQGG